MSEALPGMPAFDATPKKPRDAAAVVLFRRTTAGWCEVFWLKREAKLAFAGGFYAFPGGKLDAADASVPIEGASGIDAALRVAAARELLEETGVLMGAGAERLTQAQLDAMRRALLEQKASFAALLTEHAISLRARDFPDAGRWVTPPYMPGRFDARFYLVEAPASSNAVVWPGELSEGEWIAPAAALRRWEEGSALLHPPNLHAIQVIGGFTTVESALARLQHPPHCHDFIAERLEFQRGVRLFPLRTPTLPPATHTNSYLLGTGALLVVDPGASDEAELMTLVTHLRALQSEGHPLHGVFLTHHHGDHIGGLALLVQQLGLRVFAHPLTADRLPVKTDVLVNDGDELVLPASARGPAMHWRALHTPGHARGHLCLVHEPSMAAVVGDMTAGIGTIVIDPPEGDMAEYLRQLERLRSLPARTIYPAHGPPSTDGPAKLTEYLTHRAWRESKVVAAMGSEVVSLEALVARAYDDVASFVHPIAERNVVAIVGKLISEGRAESVLGGYRLSAASAKE